MNNFNIFQSKLQLFLKCYMNWLSQFERNFGQNSQCVCKILWLKDDLDTLYQKHLLWLISTKSYSSFNVCLTIQCWFNFVIAFLFLFFQSRILVSELKTSSGVRHFNRRNVKTLLTPVFLINMVERINVLEGILRKI